MMLVVRFFLMRKGEELKAPRHASVAATRDHVTTRDIFPTVIAIYLRLALLYICSSKEIKVLKLIKVLL